ncbi:hypothetical protein Tco_0495673 [Tanacetum coccineum]
MGCPREAWGRAMDASDLAHGEVISLRTTVHAQMSEITELQSADRRRQRAISDLLETDRRRHTTERDDSTSGTGHHTAGAGDSLTGTGDDITGAGTYWSSTEPTFQELALLVCRMFPWREADKIERYVCVLLPDMKSMETSASNPQPCKRLLKMATELMDKIEFSTMQRDN